AATKRPSANANTGTTKPAILGFFMIRMPAARLPTSEPIIVGRIRFGLLLYMPQLAAALAAVMMSRYSVLRAVPCTLIVAGRSATAPSIAPKPESWPKLVLLKTGLAVLIRISWARGAPLFGFNLSGLTEILASGYSLFVIGDIQYLLGNPESIPADPFYNVRKCSFGPCSG